MGGKGRGIDILFNKLLTGPILGPTDPMVPFPTAATSRKTMGDRPARPRPQSSGKKTMRFDPQAGDDPPPALPEGGLLDLFRRWIAAEPHEQRRAARHPARTHIVWLGWWKGNEEFFASRARLGNISRGGALVFLPHPPPEAHPVWICLGTPEPDECLAATTLEVRRARRGECTVRICFREPCPSRFLEAAVCGRTSERPGISRPGA
jgi:hypothetical protein